LYYRLHIKEVKQHGEAGAITVEEANAKRVRIREELAPYAEHNCFNIDEGPFLAYAVPDRGLSTQATHSKKVSKYRITIVFACNADGSEKRNLMFIGKYTNLCCFGKLGPNGHGFYYWNNKKGWMTTVLFDE
jgi:hypothetical protein